MPHHVAPAMRQRRRHGATMIQEIMILWLSRTHARTHAHMHTHTDTHSHTCTHTHTPTHTHMCITFEMQIDSTWASLIMFDHDSCLFFFSRMASRVASAHCADPHCLLPTVRIHCARWADTPPVVAPAMRQGRNPGALTPSKPKDWRPRTVRHPRRSRACSRLHGCGCDCCDLRILLLLVLLLLLLLPPSP